MRNGEDSENVKYSLVQAYKGMNASHFYREMAISLAKNFSRELQPLVKIELATEAEAVGVLPTDTKETLKETYTGVIITEAEQEWVRGTKSQTPVDFNVYFAPVTFEGDEYNNWATTKLDTSSDSLGNGKIIADMEYFYMGERGDIYRGACWPNVIPTNYQVDPTKNYDVVEIHYAYVGPNEAVQKSEKDITIAVPAGKGAAVESKIKNALGL